MKTEDRKAIEEHRLICARYRTAIKEEDAIKYGCPTCEQAFVLAMCPQVYVSIPVGLREECGK